MPAINTSHGRKIFTALVAASVAFSLAACGGGEGEKTADPAPTTKTTSDEDLIREVVAAQVDAFNNGDPDALYATCCQAHLDGVKAMMTPEEIRTHAEGLIDITVTKVVIQGDSATVTTEGTAGGNKIEPSDEPFTKQNGEWKDCPDV